MTFVRDSDSVERPGGGPSPFVPVVEVRTVVVGLGGGEAMRRMVEYAQARGHDVRETVTGEECAWLVATGSVDLLVVVADAVSLVPAVELMARARAEEASAVMHLLAVMEGLDGEAASGLLATGADDFLAWPEQREQVDMRLRLAEELLKRRERIFRLTRDLRLAEEKFENIFQESPDAVLIVDNTGGQILEANRKVEGVLGYDREALKGKDMAVFFPELCQGAVGRLSEEDWVRCGEPAEVRYDKPREGKIFLEVEGVEVKWGDARQLMVKVSDVRLRRELEQERIKSSKAESIRLLAGGVAHDFNNILTAIGGNLGLIGQHSFLPPESRELLTRAEGACERARSLAEQLSTFSREGQFATGLRDLGGLLRKSVHFALYAGRSRPEFYLPSDLWPVYCDETQISQVVANLTMNADQAMAERGWEGRVHVACSNVRIPEGTRLPLESGDYVRVSIKDEGPGITRENMHRIFDPYFSTRGGLSGLGLATASTIVKNHRGYLRAESIEGEGALFEFFLPALSDATMLDVAREADPMAGSSVEAARTRVLFMDDEAEIRDVVERALAMHGFEVFCAADGREAIEVYEKSQEFGEPFNVLLFDLEVRGGIGGREAVQHLRKKYPHIKALVTSGHADEKILENHREAGFSGVLTKPFRIDRLVAAVTEFAGASS